MLGVNFVNSDEGSVTLIVKGDGFDEDRIKKKLDKIHKEADGGGVWLSCFCRWYKCVVYLSSICLQSYVKTAWNLVQLVKFSNVYFYIFVWSCHINN